MAAKFCQPHYHFCTSSLETTLALALCSPLFFFLWLFQLCFNAELLGCQLEKNCSSARKKLEKSSSSCSHLSLEFMFCLTVSCSGFAGKLSLASWQTQVSWALNDAVGSVTAASSLLWLSLSCFFATLQRPLPPPVESAAAPAISRKLCCCCHWRFWKKRLYLLQTQLLLPELLVEDNRPASTVSAAFMILIWVL